jgi:hypothetical protein
MRKIVVSLLSRAALAAAGSVLIVPVAWSRDDGASRQQQPLRPETARIERVSARSDAMLQASQLRALPLDQTLIARRDGTAFDDAAFVEQAHGSRAVPSDAARGVVARASAEVEELGIELPQPGPLSATLATLALGLFFFLRRVV